MMAKHCRQAIQPPLPLSHSPFHTWTLSDGTTWAEFYRITSGYRIRFPNLADFTISADGSEINAYPVPGVSEQTIDHLYLNQVLPLALSRQYKLVLHASAVEIKQRAVAFIGPSGQGKSTLAASFATVGHRFLTDDGLQIEYSENQYLVKPSHPSLRLWDDSHQAIIPASTLTAPPIDYTPKARLLADECLIFCDEPRPLQAIFFLGTEETDTITINPVKSRDTVIEIVRHSFLLDIQERTLLTRHFSQISKLAKSLIFFQLDYPRRYDKLPEVRDAILAHFHANPPARCSS